MVPYTTGVCSYKVRTPLRKKKIRRIVRKNYVSTASALVNSSTIGQSIVAKLAIRIRGEMQYISCRSHNTILQGLVNGVKHFSWERVRLEFQKNMPTLMTLLSQLVGRASERSPLICLLLSMILKSRHNHMGLVQRAVSVML